MWASICLLRLIQRLPRNPFFTNDPPILYLFYLHSGCGGIVVGGVATPSPRRSLEGWLGFGRKGQGTVIPDARSEDNVHAPTQRSGS